MRKNLVLVFVSVMAVATMLVVSTSSSQATTGVDLGMTGSTVAGYTSAQSGQELPVTFTIKNHSTTTSATVDFFFTITHATADASDFVCPLVSNHFNIFPDTPACEVGVLGAGKSTSAAILVTPNISTGTVTVRACAMNETGSPDPVSSNNCKTVSIPIK